MKRLKKILVFIFCLTIVVTFSYRESYAKDELPTLDFAVANDFSSSLDKILNIALQNIGYDLTISQQGTTAAAESANSGEKDGFTFHNLGIETEFPNLVLVQEPFAEQSTYVYVRSESDFKIQSWKDLAGYSIGTLYQKPYLDEHIPSDAKSISRFATNVQLLDGLAAGLCDVALVRSVTDTEIYVPSTVKNLCAIDVIDGYIYLNKKHAALAPKLAEQLAKMKASGEYDQILYTVDSGLKPAQNNTKKHVLFITSQSNDSVWNSQMYDGFGSVFDKDSIVIDSRSLASDGIVANSPRAKFLFAMLRSEFLDKTPDAIIVSDQNALDFIKSEYYVQYPKTPVIFCGVENFAPDKIYGFEKYFTGIEESLSAKETVDQMLTLFPKTKNIFVINDFSDAGVAFKTGMQNQLGDIKSVDITYNDNLNFADLLSKVQNLSNDTLVLVGEYSYDSTNQAISEKEAQTELYNASPVPIFGLTSNSFGYGQIGGKYIDAYAQGVAVAKLASEVLDTKTQTAKPVIMNYPNEWKFDYEVMRHFNIKPSQLPPDSLIINLPTNIFKTYPVPVILYSLTILAFIALISWLVLYFRNLSAKNRQLTDMSKKLHTVEELLAKDKTMTEVQARLEKILDSAPILFFALEGDKFTKYNKLAEETFEIEIGSPILSIFPQDDIIHELLKKRNADGSIYGEVILLKLKNGQQHRFYLNVSRPSHSKGNELYAWLIDVEDIEAKKDTVTRAQQELLTVLDSIPIAIAITGIDRLRLFVNKAYINMLAFSNYEDAIQYDLNKLLPATSSEFTNDTRQEFIQNLLLQNVPLEIKDVYLTKLGKAVETRIFGRSITFKGDNAIVLVIQDISEEKMKTELLYKIAEQEKDANQLKNRFLISMSHEIRTPMNAIMGLAEIELKKLKSKDMIDVFKKIDGSAKNLLTIMGDILDFSKIEAEEISLYFEEIDLEEVIANALLMASQRVGSKPVEITLQMSLEVPNRVYSDQTRLWQILKNVLDNAAKYTEKGKITLDVALEKVDKQDIWFISFKITDSGFGMSKEQLGKLFTPFEQFHNNVASMYAGTGLGMVITKQLVELMDGTIVVESQENIGTTFTITIPFEISENTKTIKQTFEELPLVNHNILIADDDPVSLEIMESLLKHVGAVPVCVSSGEEAIELAVKHNQLGKPFDIIILDYLMGGLNGIETADCLRNQIEKSAKLLMVSAYTKQLLITDIEAAGYEDVIEKPFCPSDFIHKLCEATGTNTKFINYDSIAFPNAKVLLCEDNLVNQDVAVGILEAFGIVPVIAENGQRGLELLETQHFDLIFMDILMPVMDGHEATRKIRASGKPYSQTPIIAMTANVMKGELDKCLEEGMNGYISKPVRFEKVSVKLTEWLPHFMEDKKFVQQEEQDDLLAAIRTIKGIDVDDGLSCFSGNQKKYAKVLLDFAKDIASEFVSYEEALTDISSTKVRIHTIKGAAANLGIVPIQMEAAKYEQMQTKEQYEIVVDSCKTIGSAIIEYLSFLENEENPPASKGNITKGELK